MGETRWRGGNVPSELNRFVGRRELLERAKAKLADPAVRLLSLTGGGGTGKTRTAMRLAHAARRHHADGVWWVDLTSLTEAGMVGRAVLDSLPFDHHSPGDVDRVLVSALAGREALLVLDNCEHLANDVAALALRLLRGCPGLRILATSRIPLRCPGEHLLEVPPMSSPADPDRPGVSEYEAVRLFEDRAGAAQAGFAVTADNAADVARLVGKLDGIPLAIELAAPLLRAMSLPEIVAALGEFRFGALTDGPASPRHHRTLWHTFEWSYRLCTPAERLLWTRLAVFAGSFTLDAAVAVAAGPGLDAALIPKTLRDLVAKSVVSADTDTTPTRFSLLVTVREFGLSRLRDGGEPGSPAPESREELAVRRRFHRYYLRRATYQSQNWYSPDERRHLWEAAQDLPNHRAILERCATADTLEETEVGAGVALALSTLRLWFFAGSLGEGIRVLLRAEEALRRTDGPLATRLAALAKAGWIALCLGEPTVADDVLERCRVLAPAVAAQEGTGAAMANLGFLTAASGLLAQPAEGRTAAFALVRADLAAAGDSGFAPMAGVFDAIEASFRSPRDEAIEVIEKYLADAQACGAVWITSWLEWARAGTDLRNGAPSAAAARLRSALRSQWDLGDRWGPVWCVESLAWTAAAQGQHENAAVLLGAAGSMQRNLGVQISRLQPWEKARTACTEQVRAALGAEYDTLEGYGAAMALDDVIDLALGRHSGARADAPARSELSVLSEKQRAVAELIAEGRTDKQIAAALFLSPRTIQSHVSAILRTLGFNGRTEIATWVIEQSR